ncbi:MAG TPA: hypothetical protein IAB94_01000 [Candidatus Coproplasma avicola]|uniref:Uncharacterized protein n=1 Tax=Candidatus Coproplasma avicola TaxID=2840744 RepID=A0A9D1J944_9FIRM|nr:hypothetical protein [Candidatus Coproplasma avicola]
MTKLYTILRIAFCIVAVALCAVAIFVFVYSGWQWGLLCVVAAAACAGLMLFFRRKQTDREREENPPASVGDFITGPIHKNESESDENKNARDDT